MVVGALPYGLVCLSNLDPSYYLTVPAFGLVGFGAAILWTAQGVYLGRCAIQHARATGENEDAVTSRFNGIVRAPVGGCGWVWVWVWLTFTPRVALLPCCPSSPPSSLRRSSSMVSSAPWLLPSRSRAAQKAQRCVAALPMHDGRVVAADPFLPRCRPLFRRPNASSSSVLRAVHSLAPPFCPSSALWTRRLASRRRPPPT